MSRYGSTRDRIVEALSDGVPKSANEVVEATGLSEYAVWDELSYWWKKGQRLRSDRPVRARS